MKKTTTRVSPLNQKKKSNQEKDNSLNSDMIGMPGTEFRKKVEKDIKEYDSRNKPAAKPKAPAKPTPKPKPSAPTKQLKSTKATSASSKSAIKMKKC